MDTMPLNLTNEQLEIIRANSISEEAYQSTLQVLQRRSGSSPSSVAASFSQSSDLTQSLASCQTLLESLPDALIIYNNDGQVAYVNPVFSATFGWQLEEIANGRLNFVPETHRQETLGQLEKLFKGTKSINFASQRYTKSDQLLDVEISAGRLNGADDELLGIMVIFRTSTNKSSALSEPQTDKDQKQNASLQESEERLRLALKAGDIGIWEWYFETDEIYWSDNIEQILGVPAQSFGRTFEDYVTLIHPAERDTFRQSMIDVLDSHETTYETETRIVLPDQSQRWIYGQGNIFRDQNHKPIRMVGTISNNTTHREMEESLREREHLLQMVLNTIPQSVFWKDRHSKYLGCNQKFAEEAGLESTDLIIGKSDYDFSWTKEEADIFVKTDKRVLKNDEAILGLVSSYLQSDGSELWIETNKVPLHDAQNNVVGILGTSQDITKRVEAERQLQDREQLLQLILDNIPQAVFWKDRNLVYQGCNQLFAQDSGLDSAEKVIGKTDYDLPWTKEEADIFVEIDKRVIANNEPELGIVEQQRLADGSQAWVETNVIPLHGKDGKVMGILGTYQNITERIEAQQRLEASEAQFKTLVDGSLVGIYILQDGYFKYVNNVAEKLLGYPREVLLSRPALDFIHEDDMHLVSENIRRRMSGEIEVMNYVLRFVKEDGEVLSLEVRGAVSQYEGQPAILGSLVDITEAEQIRRQLDYQANLLQQIFDAVISVDTNFTIQAWNKAAEHMYGLTADEVIGHHIGEFIETKYFNLAPGEGTKLLLSEGRFSDRAFQYVKNGREIIIESAATLLTDLNGKPAGFVALNHDITDLVQAENELRQSEQRLTQLINQSPLAFIEWDENFCVREWNQTAEQVFGYSREQALGQHAKFILTEEIWPIIDDVWQHLTHLTGGERSVNPNITASGTQIICDWYNSPLVNNEGEVIGVISVVEDITEQQKAEEERQATAAERERLSQILENTTDFVGITDLEGNVVYLNAAAKRMVGIDPEIALSDLTLTSFTPQSMNSLLFEEAVPTALEQGVWQGETALLHRNGYEIPVAQLILANQFGDSETQYISTIIRDITEQKEAEAQTRLRLELSEMLTNTRTEQEVIEAIISKAGYYSKVAVAITRFVERAGQMFNKTIHQDIFGSTLIPVPVGGEIPLAPAAWELLKNNQPFISYKVEDDERLPIGLREFSKNTNIVGLAIFPIVIEGQPFGSLVAITDQEAFFDNAKINLYRSLAEQGAISLRSAQLNKRIEESLNRRSRQVQITTQISQEIASSTEIYELYQRVVELTKEEFNYYHTQLLQYNPALDAVALVVGYGEMGQKMLEMGHSLPLGTGIIGTAAATGQPVLRSDVSKEPNWRPNALLPDTKGELAIPIKLGNQVLGVLDIQSDIVDQLTQEDQIMLEGLCGQIAIAIESTRLRQDMNERLTELGNLQRLMTREGWQTFQNNSQYQSTGFLFDRNNVTPLDSARNGGNNGIQKQIDPITIESGQIISNAIAVRGEVIGTFGLEDSPENPLSQEEQDLLQAISMQVAEALENARLIEQTRKRAIELETVARVSANTSTILESEQLLQSVVNLTQSSFGLYHAHVYLFDDNHGNLNLVAGTGEVGRLMVVENWHVSIYQESSLIARAFRARQGLVVSDVRQEPQYEPNPLMPETKAELLVPMIAGDELLGILDLHSSTVGFFTEEDLRIHTTLATQIAIALQNANLYQEQLETAEKLREFDRLKSQFLASMSHELRTPLNSIIGFADVLLEGIDGDLNDRMREDVMLIRDGGQHLRALIGDILDMSKIEAGMMDLTYSNIDLQRIAHEVIATTQGLITDKPIQLILDMEENVGVIEADRTRLVQILLNLLSNAAKFTDEGSIVLSLQRHRNDFLLVGVKDSGIGIKEEDIGQVFEQFRQIGGMEHRKAGGTGLGMPITKQLVELHGGKIWIESAYGSGTTFWFTLPFERPTDLEGYKHDGYYA